MIFKTYQNRPNLQKIIVEGCNNFKPGLIEKDLQNIIVESSLICQKVYDDSLFFDLFNDLNNVYQKSPHQLANYFPIKSQFYKKLKKENNSFKHLYFYKCDFETSNFYQILKELSAGKIDDKILKEKSWQINQKLNKNVQGAFVWFKENKYFGILFLNADKEIKIDTLKHQFLHYFDWATGNVSDSFSADENIYLKQLGLIQKYLNKNFSEQNFQYVTNDKEFETLLNDFLNELILIKQKYFKNLSGYETAKMFSNDLIFKESNLSSNILSLEDYLINLTKLKYFNQLKNKSSFLMVVVYVLLQYKVETIKHHIFGKFQNAYQNIVKKRNL